MTALDDLRAEVAAHPDNRWATEQGWAPLVVGSSASKVLIISQAPGRLAQETGVPWNDPSGRLLRSWMGVTDDEFYDPANVAVLPMDFYFPGKNVGPGKKVGPGKGASGDLPPRRDFAALWHPRFLELFSDARLTIVIGGYAQRRYLGSSNVTANVAAAASFLPRFPIVHPSPLARGWRTRNPWFADETVPLLRARVRDALETVS